MRIGISTSVIQRGKTGVAQYVFALARRLLTAGTAHEFTFFALEEDFPLFEFVEDRAKLVPVAEAFRPAARNVLWHQFRLPRLAQEYGLDLLHIPSYRRLLWPRPCALVGTIHDLAPFRVPGKYDWTRMFYGRVVARQLAWRQDRVIAISETTANDITRFFGLPRERISVIHNGIDHERFSPADREVARAAVAQQHGLRRPFFLYIARLEHPGKNHVNLVSAFEEFKAATHSDWQLVFGGSDWHGSEHIHAAIKRSPFAADIRCLGFVPDSSLPEWYRAADVFVYPSLYEGFGLPPLEAMACGCPVIASPRGSLGEVLDGAAALIDPEDVHSIARELFTMATDSGARNRLRAAGLAQAQKYDWAGTAQRTLEAYAQAVSPRTRTQVQAHQSRP